MGGYFKPLERGFKPDMYELCMKRQPPCPRRYTCILKLFKGDTNPV